ncbi:MAG TPA: rhodanese-like domain-containing protein [Candidatus Tetragenococcus pullicola]|nr:rhodanese-like domain-containing protein [Candidatus Tetragenococcus pullicola]
MDSVTTQEFIQLLENRAITVLDIRDKGAYREGHLESSLSMPTTSLPNRLHELDKETTYYVLSHSGRRSETITTFLNQQGFAAVHVIGGMKALKKATLLKKAV